MKQINYYPSDSKGCILKGFCMCHSSLNGYLKDIRIWKNFGVNYVVMNGVLHSI